MTDRKTLLAREIKAVCRGELKHDEPLAKHTTFGMGGPANLFFSPTDLDDLAIAVPLIKDAGLPIFALGGGTNTLVRDAGFRGLVICLTSGARHITTINADEGIVQAGASTQAFSRRCQRKGKTGMEFGCGIPGTIGGAIWGNAGAWGGEILDHLNWLRGINLKTGDKIYLLQSEIPFGYRHTDLPADLLIVEAGFRLEDGDPDTIAGNMDQMLSERKTTQPLSSRSSGCIFKNPPNTSAGLLIDKAGCKGMSVGAVEVSDIHANFMVNLGGHSAQDLLSLIAQVRKRVFQVHKIELEPEVRILGEQGLESQ
jgi:UDP-N-acetylmuramate dehydrogenase